MLRITPADAGTSVFPDFDTLVAVDHPRGCGDKLVRISAPVSAVGSPPRMRGQGDSGTAHTIYPGITPADAGTSLFLFASFAIVRDHPRGCGDKLPDWYSDTGSQGSPPRMRGQGRLNADKRRNGRITPADAGTRCLDCRPMNQTGDHPRGCGDKAHGGGYGHVAMGSPPRMRGQVCKQILRLTRDGITPADAGTSHFDDIQIQEG